MQKFAFENTVPQSNEVFEYSKSPDLVNATKAELEYFLIILRKHFQEVAKGNERYKPYQEMVQHIEVLISQKNKTKEWYERPLGLICIGLFIAVLSGLVVFKLTSP